MDLYSIFVESFEKINIDVKMLERKNLYVTGATGLIGKMLIKGLAVLNDEFQLNLHIIALVRSKEKAKEIFSKEIDKGMVELLIGDVVDDNVIEKDINYIIHCASPTASKSFIETPVEVINTNIIGSINVLELAKEKDIESMVYVSSMEAYGFTTEEELLTEDNVKYLNPLSVRSCYPESKRMVENMCVSYASEYDVPVKIVRLAQTFGLGVDKYDTRVFAEFARCVLENRDIVLLTDGESRRMYLDTIDAVTAIITVLLEGNCGEAYNVANKTTYCSIKEMAELVADKLGEGRITVLVKENADCSLFPPVHRLKLDVSRLEELGWEPRSDLQVMYSRLIEQLLK